MPMPISDGCKRMPRAPRQGRLRPAPQFAWGASAVSCDDRAASPIRRCDQRNKAAKGASAEMSIAALAIMCRRAIQSSEPLSYGVVAGRHMRDSRVHI